MTDFEKVYREYFDDVYRYILRLSRDEHLAEDITSDTFFRALRAIDDFRGECELRVWLCQIARNCYYEHRKKTARTERRENAALQSDRTAGESQEERVARQDETAQLRTLLHELPEPYREVFLWRVYGDLSFREIGQIFHKSENWACVTYHRARNKLRERWEESKHEK